MQLNCVGGNKLHPTLNLHERHSCNEYAPLIITVLICCLHRHSAESVRPVYSNQINYPATWSLVNHRTISPQFYQPNLLYHPYYVRDGRVIRATASIPRYYPTHSAFNGYSYPSAYDTRFTSRRGSNTQTTCHYAQVQLACAFNSLCYFTPGHHKCIINVSPDCCTSNGMRNERSPPSPESKQRYRSPSYFGSRPPSIRPATSNAIAAPYRPQRPQSHFSPPVNYWPDFRPGKLVFYTPFRPRYVTRGKNYLPSKPAALNTVKNKPPKVPPPKPPISTPSSQLTLMKTNSSVATVLNGNSVAVCSSQDVPDFNSSDEELCGKSIAKPMARIVGGEEALFGEFPWQVLIKIASHQCGGSIINRKFIVTAAHCVYKASQSNVSVLAGAHDIDNLTLQVERAHNFSVSRVFFHPEFQFSSTQPDRFDIALLELNRPLVYASNILPVCLPSHNVQFHHQVGVVTGWGRTKHSKTNAAILQKVSLPILNSTDCVRWHKKNAIDLELTHEMFCAGFEKGGRDACTGDSGGPFLLKRNDRWTLLGIISAGYGCAEPFQPGIYHNVTTSLQWIKKVISSPSVDDSIA